MSDLSCFSGSGCLLNLTVPQAQACWSSGGTISGNVTCAEASTGFCSGGNQTYMAEAFQQLHYGDLTCKTSAGIRFGIKGKLLLLAVAFGAALPMVAADCVDETVRALTGSGNGTTLHACGSAFTVIATESSPAVNSSILPRQCTVPSTTSIKQTQVAQSGTWWDGWATDSGCNYCGLSSGQCVREIDWSDTTEATFSVGFDTSTEGEVLDIIKGAAGFNFGYTWGRSYTKGGSWTCYINAGDVGRLYVQNQKGWADSQTRYVSTTSNGCGGMSVTYGAWSDYQRSNWALDGDSTVNNGCSTGSNANC